MNENSEICRTEESQRGERSEELTDEGATFDYAADSIVTINRGLQNDLDGREIGKLQMVRFFGGGASRLPSLSLWFF